MKTTKFDLSAPFWTALYSGDNVSVNSNEMPRAMWNLLLSIRDCGLYSKGIRPHRFWKIGDVKAYYGIKGNASQLKEQLEFIMDSLKNNEQ